MNSTEDILSYPVTLKSKEECIDEIVKWIGESKGGRYLVCANPHSLEIANKDPFFQKAIHNADLVVPDGIGIVIASKVLGGHIAERITGSDIFLGLSEILNKKMICSYFFLGSAEDNLKIIKDKMKEDFPMIKVVGTFSPPFKPEFNEEENSLMVHEINRVQPDVLWVGMTAPKQEKWIYKHKDKLNVKFIGAIGAAFDFYTGRVKRSHPVFQKMGLEWLPRFLHDPRRLWRRNFISNPMFLLRVIHRRIMTNVE